MADAHYYSLMMRKDKRMARVFSERAATVLTHLQANRDKEETAQQIAEATGIDKKSINGIITSLQNKGLTYRVVLPERKDGKIVMLTEDGVRIDPMADDGE